jgi:hypothetical protein
MCSQNLHASILLLVKSLQGLRDLNPKLSMNRVYTVRALSMETSQNKENASASVDRVTVIYLAFQLLVNHSCHLCPESQRAPWSPLAGHSCWGPPASGSWAPSQSLPRCFGHCPLQSHLFPDLFSMVSVQCEQCFAVPDHSSVWEQGRNTQGDGKH